MEKEPVIEKCKNGTIVRTHNRRTEVFEVKTEIPFHATNVIRLTGLTANSGPLPGVMTVMSRNGKIKITTLGLNDKGIVDLYIALKTYLNK